MRGCNALVVVCCIYLSYTQYRLLRVSTHSADTIRRLNLMRVSEGKMPVSSQKTQKTQKTPALKYSRRLPTGFGDRMSVYMTVAAAAASFGADVYVYWHNNPHDEGQPAHARMSYESVEPFVHWPTNLHVLAETDFFERTRDMPAIEYNVQGLLVSYHAFDGVYPTAWQTFGIPRTLPQLSPDAFERSYRNVARETSVYCPSHEWEPVGFGKFVVLHFRGSDKSTSLSQFNTLEVLRRIPGHVPVVVVTDDDNQFNEMLSVAAPYAANITRTPRLPDASANRLCDFAVLLNATAIIQHSTNAWSSYSSVPAMMRGIPLLNTWIGPNDVAAQNTSSVGLLRYFEENGGCPVELRSSKHNEQISAFFDRVAKLL